MLQLTNNTSQQVTDKNQTTLGGVSNSESRYPEFHCCADRVWILSYAIKAFFHTFFQVCRNRIRWRWKTLVVMEHTEGVQRQGCHWRQACATCLNSLTAHVFSSSSIYSRWNFSSVSVTHTQGWRRDALMTPNPTGKAALHYTPYEKRIKDKAKPRERPTVIFIWMCNTPWFTGSVAKCTFVKPLFLFPPLCTVPHSSSFSSLFQGNTGDLFFLQQTKVWKNS